MTPTVIFLGSFQHYSAIILAALLQSDQVKVSAVLTTPPSLNSKDKTLQKNPVQTLAESAEIPCLSPQVLNDPHSELPVQPDLLFTAGYGKLLPVEWLEFPKIAALNLHFSLLPKYRGANPAEWALLLGETETGVSMIEMSPEFDTGKIIAQASLPLTAADTRLTVYQQLYELGGQISAQIIHDYANQTLSPGQDQTASPTPYAKRFARNDGFIAWQVLKLCLEGKPIVLDELNDPANCGPLLAKALAATSVSLPVFLERATRALAEFPTLWTELPTAKGPKRMKILSCLVKNSTLLQLEKVHLEGQQPALWNQVKNIVQE